MEIERGRAWAYYLAGGAGDPAYFDGLGNVRSVGHQRET
jgi:hypothetical protein